VWATRRHNVRVRAIDERPLPADEITERLRDLAGQLVTRLAGVARVVLPSAGDQGIVEGADVTPVAVDAVRVWWMHEADAILVGLSGCPGWELPRVSASVDAVSAIVNAAVAGSIEVGKGRGVTSYRVRMPDGNLREDTSEGLVGFLLSMPWKPRLRWSVAKPYR
jgi:hypothetical protein